MFLCLKQMSLQIHCLLTNTLFELKSFNPNLTLLSWAMQGLNLDHKSHREQVSWLQDEPRQPASFLAFTLPYVCPFMLCQNKDQDQGKDIKSWDLLTRLPECVFKLKGKHRSDARIIAQDSGGNNLPGRWNFMTPRGHGGSTEVLFSAFRDSRMGSPSAAGPSCRSG